MEICFVPTGDPRDALRARAGWSPVDGPAIDAADGRVVGHHGGAAGFTVGQRRGLGIALSDCRRRFAVASAPLHFAASAGNVEMVRFLAGKKANITEFSAMPAP